MKATKQAHRCDACHICLYCAPGQWQAHINSLKHKANEARRLEREATPKPDMVVKRGQRKKVGA